MDAAATSSPLRALPREESEAIARSIIERVAPTATAQVSVSSNTIATTQFVRNDVHSVGGESYLNISLSLNWQGTLVTGYTTRRDAKGLDEFVSLLEEAAKSLAQHAGKAPGSGPHALQRSPAQPQEIEDPPVFFPSSVASGSAALQGDIIRRAAEMTDRAGMIGFGVLMANANSKAVLNTAGRAGYTRDTYVEFSVTARLANGKGSGWAWGGGEDFERIAPASIVEKAIDIAKRSDNPVAVEPGRYTVILEPEALAQLIEAPVLKGGTQYLSEAKAEEGVTVFSKFKDKLPDGTKKGLQVADRRVQLFYDPYDSLVPFSPLALGGGAILDRGDWIENGVLRNLSPKPRNPQVGNLSVAGTTQTLEEMIASTRRGIWVHRFSSVMVMSELTLLLTGVTRDGTFLIEDGKVTKAIKNLRFNESPFFVLNKIEATGPMVRSSGGFACPRIKVRDFEFTSLSDAI